MQHCSQLFTISLMFCLISMVFGRVKVKNDCVCGEGNIFESPKKVNVSKTTPHKYPWIAAMYIDTFERPNLICGGSVISNKHILTAGHCLFEDTQNATWLLGVYEGVYDLFNRYEVASHVFHPRYRPADDYDVYDMAIVTLRKPIKFSYKIKPICLPNLNEVESYYGKRVTIAGWGILFEHDLTEKPAKYLMQTKLTLLSPEKCVKRATKMNVIFRKEAMLCTVETTKAEKCYGDLGGPVFLDSGSNHHVVLGVISFGEACIERTTKFMARVSTKQTVDWINYTIEKEKASVCKAPKLKPIKSEF